jgi:sn-glycerol 3-phosphate transport system substrate-binding protein
MSTRTVNAHLAPPTQPRLRLGAMAAAAALGLAACGGGGSGGQAEAPDAGALEEAEGVTTVSWWHSMDGANGEALTQLVEEFNAANEGEIEVQATYQGNYDDTITKYKAAVQSESTPSMVMIYDIGTQFMIDSQQVVPMQDFIDRDDVDVSDLQPNIAGYYTVEDRLWSMPFNTSMPVLYYNKTLFEEAGLDPEDPPETLEEIRAAAEVLSASNGGPAPFGFGASIYGWLMEQFIASNGDLYCDQENGRAGKAESVLFDSDANVEVVQWWQDMVADGLASNTGRDNTAAQDAFKAGQVAMTLESTGQVKGFTEAAEGAFDLGVGYYPKLEPNDSGPIIGGASLWINGPGHEAAEQEAAWQFVQFLAEPQSQAAWHTGTGYFPISQAALDLPEDIAWREQYPQFDVAVQQLADTELSPATQGCLLGVMPQARKASEDGLENAILGADPQEAMTEAARSLDQQIEEYNASTD